MPIGTLEAHSPKRSPVIHISPDSGPTGTDFQDGDFWLRKDTGAVSQFRTKPDGNTEWTSVDSKEFGFWSNGGGDIGAVMEKFIVIPEGKLLRFAVSDDRADEHASFGLILKDGYFHLAWNGGGDANSDQGSPESFVRFHEGNGESTFKYRVNCNAGFLAGGNGYQFANLVAYLANVGDTKVELGATGIPIVLNSDSQVQIPHATGLRISEDISIGAGVIQAENNLALNTMGGTGTVSIGGTLDAPVTDANLTATDILNAVKELATRVAALEP